MYQRQCIVTVNCRSVEKLRTLHIAWLHRKVMVEDFRTLYAFFNGPAIDCTVNFTSVEKLRTLRIAWLHRKVMVEDFRTLYAFFNGPAIDCTVNFTSVEKCVLRTEVFYHYFSIICNHAICNVRSFSTEVKFTVLCAHVIPFPIPVT